ncbi:MAG: GNAT family N-acetyltransferase [Gammaproteobacteria bacterium]|nr:GNAT family N-acetyltransferase [Gammaproteobacteria bacterium]
MNTTPAGVGAAVRVRVIEAVCELAAADWNALGAAPFPFLRHEFLAALEAEGCLGERFGWLPRHVTLWRDGRLEGAVPLYLKFNSYGEFVFDWAWADAYQRSGLEYYPKLVSASPYTPATGPKLLLRPDADEGTRRLLIAAVRELAEQLGVSSLHWLFTTADETDDLESSGLLRRTGCQFHWQNRDYPDFDAFLATLTSSKRKNIRKERRKVAEAGIDFRLLDGRTATAEDWVQYHAMYESTFNRRGGVPTLSLGFFERIAEQMPEGVLLIMAEHAGEPVASAFCLVGDDTLYGRHWGCNTRFDNLHFEACYYQGQEFCIRHGLARFEPGAQGEHKIARGFLPSETLSAHWLADRRFHDAIARHLEFERTGMREYIAEMSDRSPYRATQTT